MYRLREDIEAELHKWRIVAAVALGFALFFAAYSLGMSRAKVWTRVAEMEAR